VYYECVAGIPQNFLGIMKYDTMGVNIYYTALQSSW